VLLAIKLIRTAGLFELIVLKDKFGCIDIKVQAIIVLLQGACFGKWSVDDVFCKAGS
jgi:hypothetical protein